MGHLNKTTPEKEGAKRRGLKRRWTLTVFLPTALVLAAAAAAFALYACLVLHGGWEAAAFAACAGGAAIVGVWLLGSGYLRHVTDGLAGLTEFARRITNGSFGLKTEHLPPDEIGDLAEEINALSADVARSGKLQTEFISSVSHELRTPLTAVTGWAEALSYDEGIQGDSRRGVEIIAKETGRLTKMVEELLEFTRIQDGRFRLNIETVDVAAEVENAIYTYSRLLQQEEVALNYDCDEESVPPIMADPERLQQVLLNILDNAAKYGKDGGTIEVSVKSDIKSVIITVRDHGPGIPPTELPHIKEKFYKGSGRARGSGIGLAVCEEIVSRHGGTLQIENAEGGGTIAAVKLPVKQ